MPPKNGTMILPVSNMSDLVEKELKTGETIFEQGTTRTKVYAPVTDSVKITNKDGKLATSENCGALFAEISTLPKHNHTATVTAATVSKFCIIDGLPTFVHCNSETARGFMKLMSEPVLEMNRKVGSTQP
jgi:CRP-like cAMP-binding protein